MRESEEAYTTGEEEVDPDPDSDSDLDETKPQQVNIEEGGRQGGGHVR